jgi:hypothetical protein
MDRDREITKAARSASAPSRCFACGEGLRDPHRHAIAAASTATGRVRAVYAAVARAMLVEREDELRRDREALDELETEIARVGRVADGT